MLETKNIAELAFVETPGRKRKRETHTSSVQPLSGDSSGKSNAAAATASTCFTNAAFSSTPKKLMGRRRIPKENNNPFTTHPCLEIKSIADLAEQPQILEQGVNPFEVVRNPLKKKKLEHACFENPGLNLELPEKQFNPFEVVRSEATPSKCFVNEALNVRGNDVPASLNPYEIQRSNGTHVAGLSSEGFENSALAEDALPTNLKIGLPFTPRLNCRIDFNGLSLTQLTPSKLLAEKLVFSPVPVSKRSLGAISEETTMDIGKELDRYQLELENSINEAKLRNNGIKSEISEYVQPVEEQEQQLIIFKQKHQVDAPGQRVELEQRLVCTRRSMRCGKLSEISEVPEEEDPSTEPPLAEKTVLHNADVAYASESENEDELEFKAPARFVRAYRPAAHIHKSSEQLKATSKESLHSIGSSKSAKSLEAKSSTAHGVKQILRKSIRKLMHPMQQHNSSSPEKPAQAPAAHYNIMSSIRHSLRRRAQKAEPASLPQQSVVADVSIIDSSERTMKLRSSLAQTEYMPIEQLTHEKKHTLRNSIRHSTRALRHVFHKGQDYATSAAAK